MDSNESGNTSTESESESETSSPIKRSALHQNICMNPSPLDTTSTSAKRTTTDELTSTAVPATVRATKKRKTKHKQQQGQ